MTVVALIGEAVGITGGGHWPAVLSDPPPGGALVVAEATHLGDPVLAGLPVWPGCRRVDPVLIAPVDPAPFLTEADGAPDRAARLCAQAFAALRDRGALDALLDDPGPTLGHAAGWNLRRAIPVTLPPPRLRDDCFAMPQGVDWMPVATAQARLRDALHPTVETEDCPVTDARGRVLAADVVARRSNPPRPNAAVDGYGFAHAALRGGVERLPLVAGRAAAGQPFDGAVPHGAAVRILTGAILPPGVDTVVLEEDTARDGAAVVFDAPPKPGANTRAAGEDVVAGAPALPRGHALRAPDIALLVALGLDRVPVYRRLRVAILSTGDELIDTPGAPARDHQIYDANRPMLRGLIEGWDYEPVDLGHAPDDPDTIAEKLHRGAAAADVILTSGGASAGDEDHVSRLLRERGNLVSWRIALKPGRPLALAMWGGTPVFGLPGNPVAAFVCALVFARPALARLSGADWAVPAGYRVEAGFSKRKKPGRTEYLRARIGEDGRAEVFASEGSGRISGLAWATGLVELGPDAAAIAPGTPVRYIPYAAFGVR